MEGSTIELLDPLPLARQILRFIPVSSSEDSAGVIADHEWYWDSILNCRLVPVCSFSVMAMQSAFVALKEAGAQAG